MSDEKYELVFSGELVRGADEQQSRQNLGALFKISDEKVDALFSGKTIVLKKGLDFATANKYRVAIKKAGCRVDVVQSGAPVAPKGKAVFAASEPAAVVERAVNKSEPVSSAAVKASEVSPAPVATSSTQNSVDSGGQESVLSLAPTGSDVLAETERASVEPVVVDVSALSLKDGAGDLLDESEKHVYEAADISVDATIADVGSDLLAESERERVEPVQVDVSALSIADVGADLEQEKTSKPEVKPDISHLSLE